MVELRIKIEHVISGVNVGVFTTKNETTTLEVKMAELIEQAIEKCIEEDDGKLFKDEN